MLPLRRMPLCSASGRCFEVPCTAVALSHCLEPNAFWKFRRVQFWKFRLFAFSAQALVGGLAQSAQRVRVFKLASLATDSDTLIRICNKYVQPQPLSSTQEALSSLAVHTRDGILHLGPWYTLSSLLGFVGSSATHLRELVPLQTVLERAGSVCVSAEGLAIACAKAKHAHDLLQFAEAAVGHPSLETLLRRLVESPHQPSPCAALCSITPLACRGLTWIAERDILRLCGAPDNLEHAASLTSSFIQTQQSAAATAKPANAACATLLPPTAASASERSSASASADDMQTDTDTHAPAPPSVSASPSVLVGPPTEAKTPVS